MTLRTIVLASWLAIAAPSALVLAETRSSDALLGTRPELSVVTLDGSTFDLAAQRGRWVVINYWATWCAPCIKEIPDLSALAERDDVEVLGLDFEEIERAELEAFLQRHPARYPIAAIDVYDPPEAFPVPRGLPMTWLVDPAGRVARAFVGPVTKAELERAIADGPVAPAPAPSS